MPNALLDSAEISDNIDQQLTTGGFDPVNDPYVGALVDPIKNALEDLNDQTYSYYSRSVLELATGSDLDDKVAEFGIARGEIGIPFDDTFENFHVLISNGQAKDFAIDANSPISIPSNAISITDIDGNSFTATQNIIIQPESFSGFVPIIASVSIPGGVAPDTIVQCTVTNSLVQNLRPDAFDTIQFGCTNNKAITTPEAASTDPDLVDSAFRRINAMNNTNEDAVTFALNNYGIFDISYRRNMFGFGTLGVIVKVGGSPRISNTTLEVINNILANISPGTRAVEPETLVVKFSTRVTFVDETIIDETKADIFDVIQEHFTGLDLGSALSPDTIKEEVLAIENVDTFDFICMFIDDRPCLRTRQEALVDQLFILDETDPIVYVS